MGEKHIQFGNEGEELIPGKTENLSSAVHAAERAPEVDAHLGEKPAEERRPERFDRREDDLPRTER